MLKQKRFRDVVLDEGAVSEAQLKTALEYKDSHKLRLGQALVELGYITEEQKLKLLSKQLGFRYVDLEKIEIDEELLKEFDYYYLTMKRFIPYRLNDTSIEIIVADPFDVTLEDHIKSKFMLPVEYVLASDEQLDRWLLENIGGSQINMGLDKVRGETYEKASYNINEINENSPVVTTVNKLLAEASEMFASDIHIEPKPERIQIRYRIDGILHHIKDLPKNAHSAIVTRIKTMAEMDIAESRRPQDGKIKLDAGDRQLDARVSTLPTEYGEKITIRLLDKTSFELDVDNLGFLPDTKEKFINIINNPVGIFLLTGPTGSGKSTTLYTAINEIKSVTKNIITIEDPIEYRMDDITQVQVNPLAKLTFETGLRSILRQDPDVILVGEIRDKQTADIAVQAANTGHMVLSTLHTNDAASTLTRLVNMGLEPYMISDSLLAVLNQRLVRRLCDDCKEEYELEKGSRYRKLFGLGEDEKVILYRSTGCENCKGIGYKRRIALHELLVVDDDIKILLSKNASPYEIHMKAVENGMRTLKQDGFEKCLRGLTTIEEVQRLVNF